MALNNRVLMGLAVGTAILLTGCAKQQPGGFTEVAQDKAAHTYQFRYQPQNLDQTALNTYISQRCAQEGFDKVDPLPEGDAALPGHKTRWFQCNYSIKN